MNVRNPRSARTTRTWCILFQKNPRSQSFRAQSRELRKMCNEFSKFSTTIAPLLQHFEKRQRLALCLETNVQPSFVSLVVLMSQYRVTVFETKLFRNGTSDSYKTAQHDSYKPFCLHSVHLKIDRKLFFLPWQNNIFPVRQYDMFLFFQQVHSC